MHTIFTIEDGKAKPVDISRIGDEHDFSTKWGDLERGLKRAVIKDAEPIPIERLVLAGNPVGITASTYPGPGGSHFNSANLERNLNALAEQYEGEVIFVVGNPSHNPSYYCEPVVPAIPFRLNGSRDLSRGYSVVRARLFRYDLREGVVSVSPLLGEPTPQCEIGLEKINRVLKPGEKDKGPKWAMSFGTAGVPYASEDRYINHMLPADRTMCISSEELVLLQFPGIYCGYASQQDSKGNVEVSDNSRRNNKITNFLQFAEYGLMEPQDKPDRFPADRIVRVIGDVRGDTCCCFFSYGMLGYVPRQ